MFRKMPMPVNTTVTSTFSRCCICFLLLTLAFLSCTRQSARVRPASRPASKRAVQRIPGDTASYFIEFADSAQRSRFENSVDSIIATVARDSLYVDTVDTYVHMRIASASRPETHHMSMETIDTAGFVESDVTEIPSPAEAPTLDSAISFGGEAVLWHCRTFIDYSLLRFLSSTPFALQGAQSERPDSAVEMSLIERMFKRRADSVSQPKPSPGFFEVRQQSPLTITVTIRDSARAGANTSPTAFDLVTAWTSFVKKHPAEGLALFRHVAGLPAFIRGEEAIIPGLQVEDENTVRIRLSVKDPKARQRLHTPRLLPPELGLGPYTIDKHGQTAVSCKPNRAHGGVTPYLEKLTFSFNKDKNPFVSYSLNRYDMIVLQYRKDLDYARRSLDEQGELISFSADRYFIALAHEDPAMRQHLGAVIDPADLLSGIAKIEGTIIPAIADSSIQHPPSYTRTNSPPFTDSPLSIVFRVDDPLSSRLAEKVLADIVQAGLRGELRGVAGTEYEKMMFARSYDIAIGWAPRSVLRRESEQLRLAAIWFQDESDERRRIAEAREIPLFAVTRQLLCKPHIGFARDKLAGIHLKK
jgi:hypothetical protein